MLLNYVAATVRSKDGHVNCFRWSNVQASSSHPLSSSHPHLILASLCIRNWATRLCSRKSGEKAGGTSLNGVGTIHRLYTCSIQWFQTMNRNINDEEYDVSDSDEIESGPIGLHGYLTSRLYCQPWGANEEILKCNNHYSVYPCMFNPVSRSCQAQN